VTGGGPAAVSEPVPVAGLRLSRRFGQDRDWIAVMAILTALELAWWAIAWLQGIAPAPWIAAYLLFASVGLVAAAIVRAMRHGRPGAPWPAIVAGTLLLAIGASVFLPLKYAIPSEIPFWLDRPLAIAERSLLGADPWLVLDRWLGWATRPLDLLYGCWLPVQLVVLFLVILAAPSRAKFQCAASTCSPRSEAACSRTNSGARFVPSKRLSPSRWRPSIATRRWM